ncbi:von Willebrand factor type A domain-containing protein [Motiliproteus sp. MSK22-1]|uniref:vWA domain-containing protein n=1 Tax=Motiliproteus sp. MSK22-1 TaxID=1897630 RepID=UPI000977E391|nr:von Willebrand factor type A domain-containing protein [Motiliproteus sp. MSK22-1]OMH39256.1 hypothetical protein BGP75_03945 [Motiliproteus sp. MSK22-1]
MTIKRFTPAPLAIAITSVILFGCSSEKAAQTVAPSPSPAAQQLSNGQSKNTPKDSQPIEVDRIQEQEYSSSNPNLRSDEGRKKEKSDLAATISEESTARQVLKDYSRAETQVQLPLHKQLANKPYAESKQQHKGAVSYDMATGAIAPVMSSSSVKPSSPLDYSEPPQDRERFTRFSDNPMKAVRKDPLSTFGIDVDTASYAIARQDLNNGRLPRADSTRTEEWLNYFSYNYPAPAAGEHPFSILTEVAPSPWAEQKHLIMIGLKGYEVAKSELPPLNLTFLIDVSGSMSSSNKLPLAKTALRMLTQQLRPQDRVAITVYAGAAGLVLESTPGNQKQKIINALDQLHAGGSTAGGAGIQLAYQTARSAMANNAISRVILLSDGDFNVGTTSTEALKQLIEKERESGVSLSVLTFGRGNIRDELMNSLAEIGNGNAGYIDSAHEAKKYLVDEMSGSMMTIAKDVKAQIEFNPAVVSEYRLLGYETRHLQHHEFNDDRKDSGEIGAGHEVTALYEVTLKGSGAELIPELRYGQNEDQNNKSDDIESISNQEELELAFLKLRYKKPIGSNRFQSTSTLITKPIYVKDVLPSYTQASEHYRWAAAVAGAAQKSRGIGYIGPWGYDDSISLAKTAIGNDNMGYRAEFIRLLGMAQSLEQPVQVSDSGKQ